MRVLIVGGGGREHALAWKIAREPRVREVLVAPGSAGIATVAECVAIAADDIDGLLSLAKERGVDLTVVGPEAPLAAGIVDRFEAAGLAIFGPCREAARLEASKAFMKTILVEAGVPTARHGEFTESAAALRFAAALGYPVVVKADGLAAGKGVVICESEAETREVVLGMLEQRKFGDAGGRIVVEEFLVGEEASFLALTDGRDVIPLAPCQDHKAIFDGDRGPNTGGMGAYSPPPVIDAETAGRIVTDVLNPTLRALQARGIRFKGVLYAGLMMTAAGPKVLEYNVRFGDPECQPLMLRLESSLIDLFDACVRGEAKGAKAVWSDDPAVCVVLSAEGYPADYRRGDVIDGLAAAAAVEGVQIFHAGTSRNDDGRWITAGGRVLGVTARARDLGTATARAYRAAAEIHWRGMHYRKDIAHRALRRGESSKR